ncbi:hypothetical protein EAO27_12520 [Sphingopyxis sp. YF1]|nr:hypothetical protein EAO27_12520 [Sphingopyxis sp. YF1]
MGRDVTEINDVRPSFIRVLILDVDDALRRQKADDSSTNRRGLIRTLIAAVEGQAWIYRRHVVEAADEIGVLEEAERIALSESMVTVDDTGRISKQPRFLSTAASIRLTSRIAAKFAPDATPDFGGAGWADLKGTIALRNRITHPKQNEDLEISEDDIRRALLAFHWFSEAIVSVMEKSNAAFRSHVASVTAILELLKAGDGDMLKLYWETNP